MKTIENIASGYKSNTLDGRDLHRLVSFIPFNLIESFGLSLKEGVTEDEWNKGMLEFTRDNILKQLESDVAFGFEKALSQRGISSSLMFEVVKMWNWILEEGLENWSDNDYAQYGLPLFKATAIKYNFPNPIGEDSGNESEYSSDY